MIELNEIEFKSLSQVNQNQLFDFYQKCFPKKNEIIFKNWKWIYKHSENQQGPFVVIYKEKIIGHAGLIATNILFNSNRYKALWFVDFYILPEYQNKGIGKFMTDYWMKIEKIHLTICNNHSLSVFKKCDWALSHNYFKSCKLLNPLKWIPLVKSLDKNVLDKINIFKFLNYKDTKNKLKVFKLSENIKVIEELLSINSNNNSDKPVILRDHDWFDWRFNQSPFLKHYYFFNFDNSFIIVCIYKDQNKTKLNIIYSQFDNLDHEEILNKNLINWAIDNNIDIIWLCTNNLKIDNSYKKFYTKNFKINFVCNSFDHTLNNEKLINISNIDGVDTDANIISFNNSNINKIIKDKSTYD